MLTTRWKAAALLGLAALCGGVAGSALTARLMEGGHHRDHRARAARYVALLERELELTPAQRDSVRAILDRHRNGMDSLWVEMGARMDTVRERIRADVRLQLTPEQLARYASLTSRLDSTRRRDGRDTLRGR